MLDLDRPGSMVAKIADQGLGVADTLDKLLVGQPADVAVFGKTGVAKRADWAPAHDLAEVKRAAKSRGATVNDLMLAGIGGGIRRYLEGRGEPLKDVMTMIPVNLRPIDEPLPPATWATGSPWWPSISRSRPPPPASASTPRTRAWRS